MGLNQLRNPDPVTGERPPFVTVEIDMGSIALHLRQHQYNSILSLAAEAANYQRYGRFQQLRPTVPIKGES